MKPVFLSFLTELKVSLFPVFGICRFLWVTQVGFDSVCIRTIFICPCDGGNTVENPCCDQFCLYGTSVHFIFFSRRGVRRDGNGDISDPNTQLSMPQRLHHSCQFQSYTEREQRMVSSRSSHHLQGHGQKSLLPKTLNSMQIERWSLIHLPLTLWGLKCL